jgi:hypothetical protein
MVLDVVAVEDWVVMRAISTASGSECINNSKQFCRIRLIEQ